MNLNSSVFSGEEKAIFNLRELYSAYGYRKYRMSKFEEYDFYVRNKGFLISDNIITFTDSDGKLMALKPDVTLSIIKNSTDSLSNVQKVYYNENVYRASGDMKEIKEIMQTGLECIGSIDNYCICEVLLLAAKSLECISEDYAFDISHMGIISEAMDYAGVSENGRARLLEAFGKKNVQSAESICAEEGLNEQASKLIKSLISLYGDPEKILPQLKKLSVSENFDSAVSQLEQVAALLKSNSCKGNIQIDFSVVNNMKYYSGIAFKGFINGIHGGVLSGGQYDNLMQKMGKKSGAIGFAVYLDMLSALEKDAPSYDADIVLLYGADSDCAQINEAVRKIADSGKSVIAQQHKPDNIRFKQLLRLEKGQVIEVETDA